MIRVVSVICMFYTTTSIIKFVVIYFGGLFILSENHLHVWSFVFGWSDIYTFIDQNIIHTVTLRPINIFKFHLQSRINRQAVL